LAPVSYLLIGLGFYYAYLRKGKLSIICFILSLNMPLCGMTSFSRTLPVVYFYLLMMYFLYSIYLYKSNLRKKIIITLVVIILPVSIYFYNITENRFIDYQVNELESVVHNPLIYYGLDYNSMWIENGITVLSNYYSTDSIQYGKSTNAVMPFLYQTIGRFIFGIEYIPENRRELRIDILPYPYYFSFNGLVAEWVFDFGYFFTLILSLIYAFVAKSFAPKRGKTSLFYYINFGLIISVPLLAPYGNWLGILFYNLAIIYSLMIHFYLKYRVRLLSVRRSLSVANMGKKSLNVLVKEKT